MAVIHESEIRLLMAKMPACWKEDFKYKSACNIFANNAACDAPLAHDQRPDCLDDQIHDFLGGANRNHNGNYTAGGYADRTQAIAVIRDRWRPAEAADGSPPRPIRLREFSVPAPNFRQQRRAGLV